MTKISRTYWFLAEKEQFLGLGVGIQITPTEWQSNPQDFTVLPKSIVCPDPACGYHFKIPKNLQEDIDKAIENQKKALLLLTIPCGSRYDPQRGYCHNRLCIAIKIDYPV